MYSTNYVPAYVQQGNQNAGKVTNSYSSTLVADNPASAKLAVEPAKTDYTTYIYIGLAVVAVYFLMKD